MIRVDLHTKVVGSDALIFVGRPGGRYRFYDAFVDLRFVGPDLPGLDLPGFESIEEIEDLDDRVKRSVAYRKYALQPGDNMAPPNELEYYSSLPTTRSIAQFLRVVRAYYGRMKKGDLIIVPPENFGGIAHIGELSTQPNELTQIEPIIYGQPLTGRRVQWLASIEKNKLPAQTLDALQKPSPLFLMQRRFYPTIFRRAYGSYCMEGEFGSRFEITAERFRTVDDFRIQAFFNFVATNTKKVSEGQTDLLSLRDGAFAADDTALDLYTNVNSPGGLSLKSSIVTPLVIAAMLSLACTVGPEAYSAAVNGTLIFGNSLASASDPCTVEVSQQVVTQLQLLGFDRWSEACQVARAAEHATGIASKVGIQPQ